MLDARCGSNGKSGPGHSQLVSMLAAPSGDEASDNGDQSLHVSVAAWVRDDDGVVSAAESEPVPATINWTSESDNGGDGEDVERLLIVRQAVPVSVAILSRGGRAATSVM